MVPSSLATQFLSLLWLAASWKLITVTHGQFNPEFISIDCGIDRDSTYVVQSSRLRYVSDAGFTDAGANFRLEPTTPGFAERYLTVRYFPDGERSCYTLRPVKPSGKYLVRAAFHYGNYDGLNRPPVFDLHLGVNHWATVNFTAVSYSYIVLDAIAVSPADSLQVCLVNTGFGRPFISGLDLRPVSETMYPEATVNQSLILLSLSRPSATFGFNRYHFGDHQFRHPSDSYDRIWQKFGEVAAWTSIKTNATIDVSNTSSFDKPTEILQNAATPANGTRIDITWSSDSFINNNSNTSYLLMLYFAELERLLSNETRQFDILVDNATWSGSKGFTPKYLSAEVLKRTVQQGSDSDQHLVSLVATPDSTLAPILNAFEIYSVKPMTEVATNDVDAKAMMSIRTAYALKKNWMGDPCAPKAFAWDGLNCSYPSSGPASVTGLHLSSSGLNGVISASFGDIKSLQHLDLSNNSLSGLIPDFLAQLPSLRFIDLSSNKLRGPVPAALLQKNRKGSLVLRIDNNTNICNGGASTCKSPRTKKSNNTLVIATVVPIASVATLLFVATFFMLHRVIKRRDNWVANTSRLNNPPDTSNIFENRRFTYKELKVITSNFREEIGRGGFGGVFLGYFENGSPLAVKMRSKTSSQGDKEFLSEAQHLSRIHHRNLVSLLGFCKDKKHLALIYEYMHGGNLEDRLRGEVAAATPLTWHQRLNIALDSAHGLEYLHKSCQPPLIHRDVKTRNILLSGDLEAKIADFGLMKAFANEFMSHVTTMPAGTLGYLDPEYYNTSHLSEKSDVYSFGVVLLELITGQPPAVPISNTESIHLALWVRQRLSEGDIMSIADPRMGQEYDVNSAWKVAELALKCKEEPSRKRPTMTEVAVELKECLELELSHSLNYYCSSVSSSANNLSGTGVDLHTETQASHYPRQQEQVVIELEQAGVPSATYLGPVIR